MTEYYSKQIRKATFEELENLPSLTNETFGWSSESVPMIFILCKNEDDETRIYEYLCKNNIKIKNTLLFVDCKQDMVGHNAFAIIKSKKFDNDKLFEYAIERIASRIGEDKRNNKKFYPYMVVEE